MAELQQRTAAAPVIHGHVPLESCPQCSYSLVGSPEEGTCPECGFQYDRNTILLQGIARGVSTLSPLRVMLWIFVGLVASFVPQLLIDIQFGPGGNPYMPVFTGIALAGAAVFIFLVTTAKQERSGFEPFIIAADGFGSCAQSTISGTDPLTLRSWQKVNLFSLEAKSAGWYRLRIGWGSRGRFSSTALDAGVRCDADSAAVIKSIIQSHIDSAQGVRRAMDPLR